jgi:hypothetical protein
VGDHDYSLTTNQRRDLPAFFAINVPILFKNRIGISKGILSQCEIDVMFSVIDPVFILVPFEPNALPPPR